MKLLLDAQIMLWWLLGNSRLCAETRELMATTRCFVSVASVWEVAIKHRSGKLLVDAVSFRYESVAVGATLFRIDDRHAIETGRLPAVHEDPFDRLIIAQARAERMVAVSSDSRWDQHDITLRRP